MKYILLITLTLIAACSFERKGLIKSEAIKFNSVKSITYLQKKDTIFITSDSATIRNVIDFVNFSQQDKQSIDFKSYQFFIIELDDQSSIRIETFKTYYRRNGYIFNSIKNIDSLLANRIIVK